MFYEHKTVICSKINKHTCPFFSHIFGAHDYGVGERVGFQY